MTGPAGPQGPQGEQGPPGPNVNLSGLLDVSEDEADAFNAAGNAGASATNRLATMNDVEVASGGWHYVGQVVASDIATPWTYVDLDLSQYIGANHCLVMLKLKAKIGGGLNYWFRSNGDNDFNSLPFWSVNHIVVNPNDAAMAIVNTDESGIIEWRGESGFHHTVDIILIGYIK